MKVLLNGRVERHMRTAAWTAIKLWTSIRLQRNLRIHHWRLTRHATSQLSQRGQSGSKETLTTQIVSGILAIDHVEILVLLVDVADKRSCVALAARMSRLLAVSPMRREACSVPMNLMTISRVTAKLRTRFLSPYPQ